MYKFLNREKPIYDIIKLYKVYRFSDLLPCINGFNSKILCWFFFLPTSLIKKKKKKINKIKIKLKSIPRISATRIKLTHIYWICAASSSASLIPILSTLMHSTAHVYTYTPIILYTHLKILRIFIDRSYRNAPSFVQI